jgi:hypothetical protein
LLVSEEAEILLESCGQGLLGTVGGSDEAIELGELEEPPQQPQSSVSGLVEEEMQCQEESSEEAFASGTSEESDQLGFEVIARVVVQPVLERGTWDAVASCELSLGVVGSERVEEGSSCVSGVESCPAERLWSVVLGGVRLHWSHGSFPQRGFVVKTP